MALDCAAVASVAERRRAGSRDAAANGCAALLQSAKELIVVEPVQAELVEHVAKQRWEPAGDADESRGHVAIERRPANSPASERTA